MRSRRPHVGGRGWPVPVLAAALTLAGCGSGAAPRTATGSDARTTVAAATPTSTTTLAPADLSPAQIGIWKLAAPAAAALLSLAIERSLPPVHIVTGAPGPEVEAGPESSIAVPLPLQGRYLSQLASARRAAEGLMTTAEAAKAGYVRAAPFTPGDGVHWIRWDLVGQPFDPAHPSMLLYSDTTNHARLIAFSYYTRSVGAPPAGFAGPDDRWHQHRGLCIDAGRTVGEGIAANVCGGIWLNGADLWMLHAWIVPGETNPWGQFAPIDPKWCLDIPGCGTNPLPTGPKP